MPARGEETALGCGAEEDAVEPDVGFCSSGEDDGEATLGGDHLLRVAGQVVDGMLNEAADLGEGADIASAGDLGDAGARGRVDEGEDEIVAISEGLDAAKKELINAELGTEGGQTGSRCASSWEGGLCFGIGGGVDAIAAPKELGAEVLIDLFLHRRRRGRSEV